jgi:hypothetical protein
MSEFKINATVTELLAYLNLSEDPEKCIEILATNSNVEKTSSLSQKIAASAAKLAKDAPNRFLLIYERLKALKAPKVDPWIFILTSVHPNPQIAKTPSLKSARSVGSINSLLADGTPSQLPRSNSQSNLSSKIILLSSRLLRVLQKLSPRHKLDFPLILLQKFLMVLL